MFYALSIDDMFEEFKVLFEDKAGGTKINVFILIENYLDNYPKERLLKLVCLKQLISLLKKFLEDGNGDVRNKSLILLAKIAARLYNGNMAVDLKGDKLTKF